ncbi:ABC transporter ATP-binding protein [Natronosporangium hydrolyticum]|uniref:ABC transporter ATP-binding protein n=1 Tax=Natronosporangium hydrolyticum TaxID=2811111 RepID=A0A895YHA2_9ACTN|nr:ABC transporter ATP-binding protein [Natronosporangium hydrolyticum]QSB13896.1 ABC transporter ATP-binding protein [Natronosporangium hydrolyticum]
MPQSAAAPPRRVGLASLVPYLREHRASLVTVALLSLLTAAGTLAQPLLIRLVLDEIGAGEPIAALVTLLVVILVAVAVVYGLRNFLLQRAAEGLVLSTRRKLTGHLLRLPIIEYDQRRTGDLLSRVGADTTLLRTVVTSGLLELASGVVIVAGAAIAMVFLDPLMFAVTVASMVGLIGGIMISRRVRGVSEQAQARIGEMTATVERAISASRTIRAARAEPREAALVQASAEAAYVAGVRMAKLQAMIGPAVTTVIQAAFLAVLGIGGARVATGAISVGDLVAFVMFLFLLMMPIAQAMNAYAQLQAGLGALQRIEEMLALPAEDAGDPPSALTEPAEGAPAIAFDQVSFAYPGEAETKPVLRQVSFTVPYGSRTALVGPSGAGKSTILALVERFYDATEGSIAVAGLDVRDQPRQQLRSQLGYVEQEAPVLAGTLRDNLLLTAPDADEAQLREVLATVNLADLADRSPDGLDAQVGEGGVLLSGGERQRLAIARMLLAGPPILLLDEPTSNLDSRNEHALRQAIDAVAQQRTLLIVAHRLSTVVDADQIIVLDRGEVAAVGTHEQLADGNALYRELAAHQLLVN